MRQTTLRWIYVGGFLLCLAGGLFFPASALADDPDFVFCHVEPLGHTPTGLPVNMVTFSESSSKGGSAADEVFVCVGRIPRPAGNAAGSNDGGGKGDGNGGGKGDGNGVWDDPAGVWGCSGETFRKITGQDAEGNMLLRTPEPLEIVLRTGSPDNNIYRYTAKLSQGGLRLKFVQIHMPHQSDFTETTTTMYTWKTGTGYVKGSVSFERSE